MRDDPRFIARYSGYPRGPWTIVDTATGLAVKTDRYQFWHGDEDEMERKLAALNAEARHA